MHNIFLLEDDDNLNDTIVEFLEDNGYSVSVAYDGVEAKDILYESNFDILLLDVNVPNINGFDILKDFRRDGNSTPAIFITSLNSIDDLERGFNIGCDDYIRKPFELKELLLRVDTLIKKSFSQTKESILEITNNIKYNIDDDTLLVDNNIVSLGKKESILLKIFMKDIGKVLSHEYIYNSIWNFDETPSETSLRTYIKNLRKIIGKERIVSIKKQGYKLNIK
ncbi:Two-component system response regulator DccR [hydrothermal vent metagenome]|uniref:Two-component system response regulator DccR n=1 Tax=hydrothermal vent metagenome TaxID=652676 RepID=A0A1W1EKB0_9ZZZZ